MGESEELNEGWAWDPLSGGWAPTPPLSYGFERGVYNEPLVGMSDGKVYKSDSKATDLGPLVLETKPLIMQVAESPHPVVLVDEVDIILKTAVDIEFRLGCAAEPELPTDAWDWMDWQPAEAGARLKEIPNLPEAPYWKLALRSAPGSTSWNIDLQGFILYGSITGTKT